MPAALELKLLVPVTVHPDMFPWGAQCLRYSTTVKHPDVKTDVLDLRRDQAFVEIWLELRSRFEADVSRAMRSAYRRLKKFEPEGAYANERTFHYLATFLMVVEERPELPPAFGRLAELVARRGDEARALIARMDAVLKALLAPAANADLVVGISTYQFILLDSILLAHRVRALFPEAKLIMGGDPFDLPTARQVVKKAWLDGCVIGPGEYALNDILTAVKAGADIRSAPVPRLANQAFLADSEASLKQWNTVLEKRTDYDAIKGYHGVEWNGSTKAIHVLGRRGCLWAACTFCQRMHVITQEDVFDPSMSLMRREIERLLAEFHAGRLGAATSSEVPSRALYRSGRFIPIRDPHAPLIVRVDADDADVAAVIGLISWLKERVPADRRIAFYSYTPVRQLARPYAHGLVTAIDPRRIQLRLGVPVETLNPKTGKTMKKGASPLDAIKAMKIAADCGAIYGGLYFLFYPLETLEDVRKETGYINGALHLLTGRYVPNPYIGSYRDPIGQHPADYQIALDAENDVDPSMALLGMEVRPDSSRRYRVLGDSRLARLQNVYLSLVGAVNTAMTARGGQRLLAFGSIARSALGCLWQMALLGDFAYLKRMVLMLAFMNLPPKRIRLYLRNGEVIRERPWLLGGNWRKKLNELELRMLRYLYQQRRMDDLLEEFKSSEGAAEVLAELVRLGLVVQYHNLIISVVNDLEGLRQAFKEEDLTKLQRRLEQEDDGLGLVRPRRKQREKIEVAEGAPPVDSR